MPEEGNLCPLCGGNLGGFPTEPHLAGVRDSVGTGVRVPAANVHRLSRSFYLGSVLVAGFMRLFLLGGSWFLTGSGNGLEFQTWGMIQGLSLLLSIYLGVIMAFLWYRAWQSIQDGHARTTPGKAVGFSFIPVFNFYWVFQLTWGFAKDANAYVERHDIHEGAVSEGLFLAFPILTLVGLIVTRIPVVGYCYSVFGFVLLLVVVNRICDTVLAVQQHQGAVQRQRVR